MLKYSASLPCGINCANSDRLSAWLPPITIAITAAITKKSTVVFTSA
jgi:hypothetical protein